MSEEKQIEEMACDMCNACDGLFTTECEEKPCWDIRTHAELLYNAGYRKQSEGEWVVEAYKGDEIVTIPYIEHQHNEPFCSRCGKYALLNGGEEYVASNFCPNCGAKMKGGAE